MTTDYSPPPVREASPRPPQPVGSPVHFNSFANNNNSAPTPSTSAPAALAPNVMSNGHTHASGHIHSSPLLNGTTVASGSTMTAGQARSTGDSLPNLGDMEAKCGGCEQTIDQESGGVVVAFGSSLWHVDCFRCAKCKDRVSADTNLLLLSDGSPVCGNCSYQCFVCKQAITEEAIMTGDESYHAHCFTCRTCKRRIEELVFAKTSQGIYCMACHNERVARSRRHAEAKRQRAARKERERDQKDRDRDDVRDAVKDEIPIRREPSPIPPPPGPNVLGSPSLAPLPGSSSPHASPNATPMTSQAGRFPDIASPGFSDVEPLDTGRPRELGVDMPIIRAGSPARLAENMPLPASPSDAGSRSKAAEVDRSPQIRMKPPGSESPSFTAPLSLASTSNSSSSGRNLNPGLGVGPVGLGVPTSKAERRRSINPAMTFNMDAQNGTFAAEPRLSPLPPSPLRASFTDAAGRQGPRTPTSPSPQQSGPAFPFPQPHPAPPSVQSTSSSTLPLSIKHDSTDRPARTSSLPDQLASQSQDPLPTTEEEKPVEIGVKETADADRKTPKLTAPDLPAMSFSLSDPDFALILSTIDQTSPQKEDKPTTANGVVNQNPATSRIPSSSSPSPPTSTSQTSISRNLYNDTISPSSFDSEAGEFIPLAAGSGSPSRSRLGTPQLLRTRQPSAESTTSVFSRFGGDTAFNTVVELVASAKHGNTENVSVDLTVLSGVVAEVEELRDIVVGLRSKYTGAKRTSQQYSEGLTVAGEEYDKELAMRRDLEAEVSRLKAQVHSQTARLSVISGDERRQENMRRRSHDLAHSLTGLERDISRLRAQRDMTLAEVEELNASRLRWEFLEIRSDSSADSSVEDAADALSQSLTSRLDTIKEQYREELEPLTAQREALQREIAELRETREQFLEESTALAAKNEELAELNAQLSRQVDTLQDTLSRSRTPTIFSKRTHPSGSPSLSSLATSATLQEVPEETARVVKVTKPEPIEAAPARRFKWYKSSKGPDMSNAPSAISISKPLALPTDRRNLIQRPSTEFGLREHSFQQHSTMRLTRCELCQEKMWGLQEVRCSSCGILCHSKCAEKLPRSCTGTRHGAIEVIEGPLQPTMFGKALSEQVSADKVAVPVVVTKCIYAVEAVGMEYEGIYRKTGGSSQSKQITQLFERGDYDAFDLSDVETFNDISSVTSVLKTYFRQLPDPLLTHALHESFVAAASIRDSSNKHSALCALLKELPKDHYNTLRTLMLHLHRVTQHASVNLMTSQNLGVVFGPTLMRSSDPNREFGDMAGKALSIQWMVENAPAVFAETQA